MSEPNAAKYLIVVGLDLDSDDERALDAALELAERRSAGAVPGTVIEVHALHVGVAMHENVLERVERACRERLAALSGRLGRKLDAVQLVAHVRLGHPARQIAELGADVDADLIVVGTHGRRGVRRPQLGSVAGSVLKSAHCPVLVVRQKDHERPRGRPSHGYAGSAEAAAPWGAAFD